MNIKDLLSQDENRKLEFKEKFPEKASFLKTMISFANGNGGHLIIGVSDKEKQIIGVEDPLLLEEKIINLVYDSVSPVISPYIVVHNIDNKPVVDIQVLPGENPPYYIKSKGIEKATYIRIGSSNRIASLDIINELRRHARGISYEYEMDISKTMNNLNNHAIEQFISAPVNDNLLSQLEYWKIIRRDNGDYFPTIAGLVLFGNKDLIDYDYTAIRVTRFEGTDYTNIAETKEFNIPLILSIEDIFSWIHSRLKKESVLEGVKRLERNIIPDFAIREALVNAIVHRDYSNNNSTIKINLFPDRIEFINPGILFGNIDISDLGSGISECRNRNIVRIFRKLNLMEELGTGIARIKMLFEEANIKNPLFLEQNNFFKTILPQEFKQNDINQNIIKIINTNNSIGASEIANILGLHHNTVLKYLNKLISLKKISANGKGRNRRYIKNS